MTNRNRAWRRRKARLILGKIETTKNWLMIQFQDPKAKPVAALKQHKHGKLTKVQALRQKWQLNEEMIVDGAVI